MLLWLCLELAAVAFAIPLPVNDSATHSLFGRHTPPLSAVLDMARATLPDCSTGGTAIDVGARGAEETAQMLTANFSTLSIECQTEEFIRIYELLHLDNKLTLLNLCATSDGPAVKSLYNAEGATTLERSALSRPGENRRHQAARRKIEPILSLPLDTLIWKPDGTPNSGIDHPVCGKNFASTCRARLYLI